MTSSKGGHKLFEDEERSALGSLHGFSDQSNPNSKKRKPVPITIPSNERSSSSVSDRFRLGYRPPTASPFKPGQDNLEGKKGAGRSQRTSLGASSSRPTQPWMHPSQAKTSARCNDAQRRDEASSWEYLVEKADPLGAKRRRKSRSPSPSTSQSKAKKPRHSGASMLHQPQHRNATLGGASRKPNTMAFPTKRLQGPSKSFGDKGKAKAKAVSPNEPIEISDSEDEDESREHPRAGPSQLPDTRSLVGRDLDIENFTDQKNEDLSGSTALSIKDQRLATERALSERPAAAAEVRRQKPQRPCGPPVLEHPQELAQAQDVETSRDEIDFLTNSSHSTTVLAMGAKSPLRRPAKTYGGKHVRSKGLAEPIDIEKGEDRAGSSRRPAASSSSVNTIANFGEPHNQVSSGSFYGGGTTETTPNKSSLSSRMKDRSGKSSEKLPSQVQGRLHRMGDSGMDSNLTTSELLSLPLQEVHIGDYSLGGRGQRIQLQLTSAEGHFTLQWLPNLEELFRMSMRELDVASIGTQKEAPLIAVKPSPLAKSLESLAQTLPDYDAKASGDATWIVLVPSLQSEEAEVAYQQMVHRFKSATGTPDSLDTAAAETFIRMFRSREGAQTIQQRHRASNGAATQKACAQPLSDEAAPGQVRPKPKPTAAIAKSGCEAAAPARVAPMTVATRSKARAADATASARASPAAADEQVLRFPPDGLGAVTLLRSDLDRLAEGEFLNDTVIEFGLKVLHQQIRERDPDLADQIYFFNSFFYKRLTESKDRSKSYANVRKWTNKVKLFDKKYIVVPINEHLHWYLAIICHPAHILESSSNDSPSRKQLRRRSARHSQTIHSDEDEDGEGAEARLSNRAAEMRLTDAVSRSSATPAKEIVGAASSPPDIHDETRKSRSASPSTPPVTPPPMVRDSDQTSTIQIDATTQDVKAPEAMIGDMPAASGEGADDEERAGDRISMDVDGADRGEADGDTIMTISDDDPQSQASQIKVVPVSDRRSVTVPRSRDSLASVGQPASSSGNSVDDVAQGAFISSEAEESEPGRKDEHASNIRLVDTDPARVSSAHNPSTPNKSSNGAGRQSHILSDSLQVGAARSAESHRARPAPLTASSPRQASAMRSIVATSSEDDDIEYVSSTTSADVCGSYDEQLRNPERGKMVGGGPNSPASGAPAQARKRVSIVPGGSRPSTPPLSSANGGLSASAKSHEAIKTDANSAGSSTRKRGESPPAGNRTCVIVFDSLRQRHGAVKTTLVHYLRNEAADKLNYDPKDLAEPKQVDHFDALVPEQPNFCDCGVYLLHYVERFFSEPAHFLQMIRNKQDKDSAKWEAGAVSNKRQEWRVVADSLKDEWDRHRKQLDDEKKARANAKRQAEFQASNAEKQERREQQAQQGKQAGAETT